MAWLAALPEAELAADAPRALELEGTPVLLTRLEDGVHAVHATCLHRGVSLGDGTLEGATITCSAHFWSFDVRTGVCTQIPDQGLRVFNVKTEEGTIYVEV
jgi:nitrite reductase/ring-hydroxylating ferredoxin subunit